MHPSHTYLLCNSYLGGLISDCVILNISHVVVLCSCRKFSYKCFMRVLNIREEYIKVQKRKCLLLTGFPYVFDADVKEEPGSYSKCKTLHKGSGRMLWFFWDRLGLGNAEISMKIKHKCRNLNKPDTVILGAGRVITVLSFALLRALWKFSEISLCTDLEVRFNITLAVNPDTQSCK